jgi:MFS family permease
MRPLDLGQTIDSSMKIVQRQWRTLAVVVLVVAGPLQVLSLIITVATTDSWSLHSSLGDQTDVRYTDEGAYAAGQAGIIALAFLSYLLGTVACYRAVADTYLGRATSVRESLAFAVDRLGASLWLSILLVVAVIAGFLAFVVPGVWLFVAFSVAVPAMLVEGVRGTAALRRSSALTKDRWWATAGRLLVGGIIGYVVGAAASVIAVVLGLLLFDEGSLAALVIQHAGALAGSLFTTPFLAAVTVLVYFDLRVRKERFDPGRDGEAAPETFGGWLPPSAEHHG